MEKKRKDILKRDKNQCVKCGSKNRLHVHHKKYIYGRNPWEYDNFFLEVLCANCHEKEHEKHISSFIISKKQSKIELSKNKPKNNKSKNKRYVYKNLSFENDPATQREMNDFKLMLLDMRKEALLIMNEKTLK